MRRAPIARLCIILALIGGILIAGLFGPPTTQRAHTQPTSPTTGAVTAPPIRGPEGYESEPYVTNDDTLSEADRWTRPPAPDSPTGLKAVAIVGEVDPYTDEFIGDMNNAVSALQSYGVTVETFYYGQASFTWDDIVTATVNAHFLLYMGHGVFYDSWENCSQPAEVGGFYLGYGPIVTPDTIRQDLTGRMHDDGVVILSHACYSAGNTACDPSGWPSLAEAERRVRMYAAPFVDIGLEAYFANNYYNSMTQYIHELLAPVSTRKPVGDIFKTVFPYNASEFRDLDYPDADAYDLWLSGSTGEWDDAFVGIPTYVFQQEASPEFGPLPASIDLTYDTGTETFTSGNHELTIENVGNSEALSWQATQVGDWFTSSPSQGTTPDDPTLALMPNPEALYSLGEGAHGSAGAITVTITDPPETEPPSQRVDLRLTIEGPKLGDLGDALAFTYFPETDTLIPEFRSIQPQNTGTGDALTWRVDYAGDWLGVTPTTGTTPDTFTVVPDAITGGAAISRTAVVTVTATDPPGTFDRVQSLTVTLSSSEGEPGWVYLPMVVR